MPEKTYSISELNEIIKSLLAREPRLQFIQVCGEISNYKVYPSGHAYFTLKDNKSTLKAVCFKSSMLRGVRFKPENGMQIIALGRIDVYERDGIYQMYVERMLPSGHGDIMQLLEQIKARLQQEGLFDPKHKKSLPLLPRAIGLITSPSGAAVRDIIKVAKSRYPGIKIYLVPVRVQGLESEMEIIKAMQLLNSLKLVDVIILGRGGGSKEDLWVFNSEQITRKVFASQIPVVSAVGHETDYTLVDYAADLRAATPSQAAEIVVPNILELLNKINILQSVVVRQLLNKLHLAKKHLESAKNTYVLRRPEIWLAGFKLNMDGVQKRLISGQAQYLLGRKQHLREVLLRLNSANPLAVMERGFVGLQIGHKNITSVQEIELDALLDIRLKDGLVRAQTVSILEIPKEPRT